MKQKKVKRKVLQLFGSGGGHGRAVDNGAGAEGEGKEQAASRFSYVSDAYHDTSASRSGSDPDSDELFPNGFGGDMLDGIIDGDRMYDPLLNDEHSVKDDELPTGDEAWESALSGAGDDGINPLRSGDSGQGSSPSGPERGGAVLPLFGARQKSAASRNGQWSGGSEGYLPSDLGELLELLSIPEFGPSGTAGEGQDVAEVPLRFPTLDRVMGRLGTAIGRRLYALSTRRWVVVPGAARRVQFAAWSRFSKPVSATLTMQPLEGVALFGADSDLVQLITSRLMDRGPERTFPELHPQAKDSQLSRASQAVAAHCLHVFQLDLEWALAPFFEVETSRYRVLAPDEPIIEFGEQDECILVSFSVSDGEFSGRLMLLFPVDMLRPLEMLLASNRRILMPASTETDDEAFLRLRILSDEQLSVVLSESHPLLASVVLYQMSEDRRLRVLQRMSKELQEELVRRMGRRASVLRTLSMEQRVAVRSLLMGEAYTSHILRMCTPEKAARFLGTIATLPSLFPSQATEICAEDNPGIACGSPLVVDKGIVGRLLMRSFTSDTFIQVSKLLAEGAHALPFDCLSMCSTEGVASMLAHETYGVCGMVLRHLLRKAPEMAAAVFALLQKDAQAPVFERVLMPRSVDVDIVHTVEKALCEHVPVACSASTGKAVSEQAGAVQRCSELLCSSDARVLLSAMKVDARNALVEVMEKSGIPMPSDCKPV
ncbi:hypothetical protein N1030_07995 [Desulfovibrio mangrovi]|uniref:hypothetical protein n=1 Tax=Desulfovibrio mangrovi TaxID=2976983 RepID=UPI0022459912|nr:hypothetical protein [Desulfovibrio mangrovi]UZP68900.1 hypothetical protein N1030_07995 [Desulfovibrio mangrovi]